MSPKEDKCHGVPATLRRSPEALPNRAMQAGQREPPRRLVQRDGDEPRQYFGGDQGRNGPYSLARSWGISGALHLGYYHASRTHLSLAKDAPETRAVGTARARACHRYARGRRPAPSLHSPRCVGRHRLVSTTADRHRSAQAERFCPFGEPKTVATGISRLIPRDVIPILQTCHFASPTIFA
jgi:hypothetical protein